VCPRFLRKNLSGIRQLDSAVTDSRHCHHHHHPPSHIHRAGVTPAKKLVPDFTTNASDRPLIVQFGAHSSTDFARAAEMVKPYADGINLNCGCPQTWAIQEGIGCKLIQQPQLVKEMVRAAKDRCGEDFCVSIKIRIHHDLRETVDFVKIVEDSGVDYITVHGRRRSQRSSEPVNLEAIALVKSVAGVPIVANGDVFNLEDVKKIVGVTGVDGKFLSVPRGSGKPECWVPFGSWLPVPDKKYLNI